MKQEFKDLYNTLQSMPYEAHWLHTIPPEDVLKGVPSDCSDRTWVLADWCEQHNIKYRLVWSLFTTPLSLHVSLMVDGYIYVSTHPYYEEPYTSYKRKLGAKIYLTTGGWIRYYIRLGEDFIKQYVDC